MTTDVMASNRAALLANASTVTAITSTRIYAKTNPPPGYNPAEHGACLVFNVRGGGMNYSSDVLEPSITYRCIAETEEGALTLYAALLTDLQDLKAATNCLIIARLEVQGQLVRNSESDWPEVFCAFRQWFVFED